MKKYRTFLTLLALMLLVPIGARSQETLTVADGTVSQDYVPFQGFNADHAQHNQMIYPASLLESMAGSSISQMVFYINTSASNGSNTAADRMGTWTVSLGETTETTLSALDNTTPLTQVYEGNFDCSTGTLTIEFEEPYFYEGGNLLIDLDHAAASWNRWYFLAVDAPGAAYTYNSVRNYMAKCTFTYVAGSAEPTCKKPSGLRTMEVASTTAYLKWNLPSTSNALAVTSFGYECGDAISGTVDTAGIILTDLEPGTTYTFRVWTNCGSASSDDTLSISFTTRGLPVSEFPYSTGFEEGQDLAWEFVNGTLTNKWVIGSAVHNGENSTSAMYISNDNGTTNAYTVTSATMVYATRDLQITEEGDYAVSYDWIANGESTYDYIRVVIVPMSVQLNAGTSLPTGLSSSATPSNWIAVDGGAKLNLSTSWANFTGVANLAPGNYKLVFAWRNDTSGGSNPPAAIDNVSITKLPCSTPVTLALDTTVLSTTTASISWVSGASEFEYEYADSAFTPGMGQGTIGNTSTNSVDFTELQPSTHYYFYVRAICGSNEGDTSFWSAPLDFYTECELISELPYNCGFEANELADGSNAMPMCWTRINDATVATNYYPYSYNSNANTGSRSLYFSFSTSDGYAQNEYAVLPAIDASVLSLSNMQLSFFGKAGSGTRKMYIGSMTDVNDITTFTLLDSVDFTATYQRFDVNLTDAPEGDAYVAFKGVNPGASVSLYVDDVILHEVPACDYVTGLTASQITTESAVLTWTDENNNDATYTIYNVTGEEAVIVESNVSGTTYEVTGLEANSRYLFAVAANCSGSEAEQVTVRVKTNCVALDVPYEEDFNAYQITSTNASAPAGYPAVDLPDCWSFLNMSAATSEYPQVFITSNSGYPVDGKCLFFKSKANASLFAVMPLFNEPGSDVDLKFTYRNEGISASNGTMIVGMMTDASDSTTFVAFDTLAQTTTLTEKLYTIPVENYVEGARIAFRYKGGTSSNYYFSLDNISLMLVPSCPKPTALQVRNVTATEAEIVITDSNDSPNYRVLVYTPSDTVYNEETSEKVIAVEELTPNTAYMVKVVADCGDGTIQYPITTIFRTACTAIAHDALPFVETFESYTAGTYASSSYAFAPDCWSVTRSNSSYYPYVSSSQHKQGAKSLYIYSNATTPSVVVMPAFEDDLSTLMLSFWMRTSSANQGVEVGVMSSPNDTTTFVPIQTITTTSDNYTVWDLKEVTFAGQTSGYIAFRYKGTSYGGAYIDSLVVDEVPACTRPSTVLVSDITIDGANVTIADANDINEYTYALYMNDTVLVDSTNCSEELVLTNLNANTPYTIYVRTVCSTGDLTAPTVASFRTACVALTVDDLPWVEDFENYSGNDLPCYNVILGGSTSGMSNMKIDTVATRVHSGTKSLRFGGYATRPTFVVLPEMDVDINTLQLNMWVLAENATTAGELRVGYITDPTDSTTFVQMTSFSCAAYTSYAHEEVTFANAPEGARIAIAQKNDGSNTWWWIDSLVVDLAPSCGRPASVAVSDITTESATLTISDPNNVGSYIVVVRSGNTVVDSNDNVTTATYEIQNLSASTAYTVDVATNCPDGMTNYRSTSFATACGVITTFPWTENFETQWVAVGDANPAPLCWTVLDVNGDGDMWAYASSGINGGSANFYSDYNTANNDWLIAPAMQLDGNKQLRFLARNYSNTTSERDEVSVWITNDDFEEISMPASATDSLAGFTCIFRSGALPTGPAQEFEISLAGYEGVHHIAFVRCYAPADGWRLYIDDVTVEDIPSCTAPTIALGEVTTTSAVITLSDANNVNHYQLYVDNDATGIEVTGTTYTIQNLSPASSHTVYAKTLCEGGDTTRASVALSFNTECNVIATLPWSENFDNATSDVMPACWDVFFNGSSASSAPHVGTSSYQTDLSGKWLYFAASNSSTSSYGNPQMAILPPFQAAINTLTVTFRYEYESASYGTLEVGYVTGADFNTDFVAVKTCTVNTDGTDDTVSFATAPAEAERIAFRWTNNYSTYYTAGVDNIVVDLNGGDVPPVGINEVEAADIVLYPNPATSNVTLRGVEAGSQVSVVDMNGRMVRDFKAANDNVRIDVSNLAKGAYFVRVVNGNTNAIRKLIVK